MTLVWDSPFPSPVAKLIALKLADYANDTGANVFPSRSTIERETMCQESTVKKWLAVFERAELLVVETRSAGGARKNTTRRRFNMQVLSGLADGSRQFRGVGPDKWEIAEVAQGGHEVAGPPYDPATKNGEGGHVVADRGPPGGPKPSSTRQGPPTRGAGRKGESARRWAKGWTPNAIAAVDNIRGAGATAHVAAQFFDEVGPTLRPSGGADPAAYVDDVTNRLQRYEADVVGLVARHMKAERKCELPSARDVEAVAARLARNQQPAPGFTRITNVDDRFERALALIASNSPPFADACRAAGFVDVRNERLKRLEVGG